MRATNATLSAARGYRVRVPANDRVEVRFPVKTVRAGKARFQIAAAAGRFADAANFELPVWTPATTEAFATYGQIDKGAIVQPVQAPTGVVRQFGGLEVTTSSTALQALTDAVIYLTRYPFECTEQMSSRILGIVALRDVLSAFKAEGLPKPEEMVESVKRDVTLLSQLQNGDGGFSFWRRGDPSWPYVSIHVANALVRAKAKGFEVPQATLDRSREHLRQIERYIPSWYGIDARRTLIAYALNVRQAMGDRDVERARSLVREAGATELSFEALGFVLPVLSGDAGSVAEVAAIRKHLANRVSETAGAAHFVVSYGDNAYLLLHSDRRADAILLEALIADQPGNDLIPKLVRGAAGAAQGGALAEYARERLRPAGPRPLLQQVREGHARLRRPPVAGAPLRGRACLPRAHDGAAACRHPDGGPRREVGRAGAAHQQGGARAALLPDRPQVRAGEPEARRAGSWIHRRAALRGRRRQGRRHT